MFLQIPEYFRILISTNLGYYLNDTESLVYTIFITGLIFVCPAFLIFQARGAIIVSILVSIPILFITLYGLSWGKPELQLFNIRMLAAILACILIYGSYIFFLKSIYLYFETKQNSMNTMTLIYMLIFIVLPIGYYVNAFFQDVNRATESVSMDVQVSYDFRNPVYINELKFINSKKNITNEYPYINGVGGPKPFIAKSTYKGLSLKDRFLKNKVTLHDGSKAGHGRKSDSHKYQIPLGTDKFILSWYSYIEDKYYSDEFPFPYEKMKIERKYNLAYDRYTRIIEDPVTLHLWPGGSVSLYQPSESILNGLGDGQKGLANYVKVVTKNIDVPQKEQYFDYIINNTEFQGTPLELKSELEELKNEKFDKKFIDRIVFYDWTLIISNVEDSKSDSKDTSMNVKFLDSHYNHIKTVTGKNYRSSLPQVVVFRANRKEYAIYFDMIQLVSIVKKHVQPTSKTQNKPAISFEIIYGKENYQHTKINLIMGETKVNFEYWQIEITYDWDK
ncbi:MAG: hypothetical protein HOO06_02775 [Bdellovibrionaceae bacterium]|jgi:hypothetical protein|nr:hypothetical protein [Pseudobdellovibrionaceae bacterium]